MGEQKGNLGDGSMDPVWLQMDPIGNNPPINLLNIFHDRAIFAAKLAISLGIEFSAFHFLHQRGRALRYKVSGIIPLT